MNDVDVVVEYILREDNNMADFITNQFFYFAAIERITYNSMQDILVEDRGRINMDRHNILI